MVVFAFVGDSSASLEEAIAGGGLAYIHGTRESIDIREPKTALFKGR